MEKNDQSYLVTEKVGELMGKYAVTFIITAVIIGKVYKELHAGDYS